MFLPCMVVVMADSRILISVVICTFNRAELLTKAIQSICDQSYDPRMFELIIVDNNSSDNTAQVVAAFTTEFAIRYVRENQQGLSHARNRGWREAYGEYVGYLDDDAIAPPHWLALASAIIETEHPLVFGGPVREYTITKPPQWYKASYLTNVDLQKNGPIAEGEGLVAGGNMFCNRAILESVGGFDPKLGMSGTSLGYAEEDYLQYRIRRLEGRTLIYGHMDLYIRHLARPEKLTWRWKIGSAFVLGRYGRRQISLYQDLRAQRDSFPKAIALLVITITKIALMIPRSIIRNRERYPYIQNYFYEKLRTYMFAAGYNVERCLSQLKLPREN